MHQLLTFLNDIELKTLVKPAIFEALLPLGKRQFRRGECFIVEYCGDGLIDDRFYYLIEDARTRQSVGVAVLVDIKDIDIQDMEIVYID